MAHRLQLKFPKMKIFNKKNFYQKETVRTPLTQRAFLRKHTFQQSFFL